MDTIYQWIIESIADDKDVLCPMTNKPLTTDQLIEVDLLHDRFELTERLLESIKLDVMELSAHNK